MGNEGRRLKVRPWEENTATSSPRRRPGEAENFLADAGEGASDRARRLGRKKEKKEKR